ncbi:MAG: repeat protein [Pedosphaera sp.]|nr:repeat protein [Pedosphaera sp.]
MNAAMRKRSRIALTFLLLAVIGGIAWLALRPSEPDPVYKGKRLSVWLEDYVDPNSTSIAVTDSDETDEAVRRLGTNAIPILLRRLRAKDSTFTSLLGFLSRKLHLFKVNFTPAWLLQQEGIQGFQALGSNGKAAVPELIRMYALISSQKNQNAVAAALGGIGPAAEDAVPILVGSLADTRSDSRSRRSAIVALGHIHAHPEIALPALVKCLGDQNSFARQHAAQAIGAFDSDAKLAVPDLLKLLTDSSVDVQGAARDAIKQIDPEAAAKAGLK